MNEKSQVSNEKIIGVDLHPDSFSLALTEQESAGTLRILQQITHAPTSSWCEHLKKLPQRSVIVCEASGNSFELMKAAESYGFRTCILNSTDVGQLGKKLCKTDKQDAVRIAKIYLSNLASEVWLPDENTRDMRQISSMFGQISKDVTRVINQIKNVLTTHDVRLGKGKSDLLKPEVRKFILRAHEWSEMDLVTLKGYYAELDHRQNTKNMLYELMLKQVHASRPMRELLKLCGIRVISAFHIMAAIGDINRFSTPKKLVAYLGVAPCTHQSGCREYSAGVQRDGRRLTANLLVECARSIQKSKNVSAKRLRDWAFKLQCRRNDKVATCGLARKIAVAIWYALRGYLPELEDNETTLKRKLASIYSELKLDAVKALGYQSRKAFIDEFSFAILTQKQWGTGQS